MNLSDAISEIRLHPELKRNRAQVDGLLDDADPVAVFLDVLKVGLRQLAQLLDANQYQLVLVLLPPPGDVLQ